MNKTDNWKNRRWTLSFQINLILIVSLLTACKDRTMSGSTTMAPAGMILALRVLLTYPVCYRRMPHYESSFLVNLIEYSWVDDKHHERRKMCTLRLIESNNDQIEYKIKDEKELRELLNNLVKQVNRVVILDISNIGIFTLGIGLPYGFIQYSKSGDPPYLIATGTGNDELIDLDDEEEFDANGTPTPIPKRLCIPYARIVNIIIHFYKNHELPQFERWVEI